MAPAIPRRQGQTMVAEVSFVAAARWTQYLAIEMQYMWRSIPGQLLPGVACFSRTTTLCMTRVRVSLSLGRKVTPVHALVWTILKNVKYRRPLRRQSTPPRLRKMYLRGTHSLTPRATANLTVGFVLHMSVRAVVATTSEFHSRLLKRSLSD